MLWPSSSQWPGEEEARRQADDDHPGAEDGEGGRGRQRPAGAATARAGRSPPAPPRRRWRAATAKSTRPAGGWATRLAHCTPANAASAAKQASSTRRERSSARALMRRPSCPARPARRSRPDRRSSPRPGRRPPRRVPLGVTRKLPGPQPAQGAGEGAPGRHPEHGRARAAPRQRRPRVADRETAIRTWASGQVRSEGSIESGRRSPGTSRSQPPARASSTQSEAAARIARSRCVGVPPRGSKTTSGPRLAARDQLPFDHLAGARHGGPVDPRRRAALAVGAQPVDLELRQAAAPRGGVARPPRAGRLPARLGAGAGPAHRVDPRQDDELPGGPESSSRCQRPSGSRTTRRAGSSLRRPGLSSQTSRSSRRDQRGPTGTPRSSSGSISSPPGGGTSVRRSAIRSGYGSLSSSRPGPGSRSSRPRTARQLHPGHRADRQERAARSRRRGLRRVRSRARRG